MLCYPSNCAIISHVFTFYLLLFISVGHFAVSCHVKQLMLIFVRNQDQHRHRNEYYSQQCKLKVILANDSANQMCGNTISRVIQCLIMIQKFPELELNV